MMVSVNRVSSLLKIGIVLFCFMCLFFATYMASRYEYQKTETGIQTNKVKELEEKIDELSTKNQELLQIRSVLVQEKDQMAKEIDTLREKCIEFEGWKHAIEKETLNSNLVTNHQSMDDEVKKKLPEDSEAIYTYPSPASVSANQSLMVEKENSTVTQPDNTMPNNRLEEPQEASTSK